MIQNEQELKVTRDRIAYLLDLLTRLRVSSRPEELALVSGGYRAEVEHMQREDFQRRYREAQEKAFDGALGTLQGAATLAIATLQKNLNCGTPAAENQAANILLGYTLKVREQFGLAERMKELEARLKDREDGT